MEAYRSDLRFESTRTLDRKYQKITELWTSDHPFLPAARAFSTNLDRVLELRDFAALSIGLSVDKLARKSPAARHIAAQTGGRIIAGGGVESHVGPIGSCNPPVAEADAEALRLFALNAGYDALPEWAAAYDVVNGGLTAALSHMASGAWTAFEGLVKDAWNAAVKTKPSLLPKATSGFASLRKQEATYYATFGSIHSIWPGLEAIFKDQQIIWLAKFRNVLEHNGGIADAEFVQAFGAHTEWSKLVIGEPILIRGDLVAPLIAAAASRGAQLLRLVTDAAS